MSGPFHDIIADDTPAGAKARTMLSEELDEVQRNAFDYLWEYVARPEQLPPAGDWRVWMIMAGRGFGKTRAGAAWVRMIAATNPYARIALISSSLAQARAVMVEGDSGLLAVFPPAERPRFEASLHRARFRSGAQAQKEFFVNQALAILDAFAPRAVATSLSEPPSAPAEGDCFRVIAPASQEWAGCEDHIAIRIGGA